MTSAVPLIEQPLFASYNGRSEGILLRGMRMEDIRRNTTIRSHVIAGALSAVTPGSGRVAIGARLAEALGVDVGGEVTLINPQGQSTPFGTVPRMVPYTVGAIFEVGVYDFDKAYVVMPLPDAQQLLLLGDSVGMVELQTTDSRSGRHHPGAVA